MIRFLYVFFLLFTFITISHSKEIKSQKLNIFDPFLKGSVQAYILYNNYLSNDFIPMDYIDNFTAIMEEGVYKFEKSTEDFEAKYSEIVEEKQQTFFFHYGVQAYISKDVSVYYLPVGMTIDDELKLNITLKIPYVKRQVHKGDKTIKNSGIGDSSIYLRRLIHKGRSYFIPSFFIKFPTGKYKKKDKVDVSTGTGSIDYGFMMDMIYRLTDINNFYLSFSYTINGVYRTPDDDVREYGNVFTISFADEQGFFKNKRLWLGFRLSYVQTLESYINDKEANDDLKLANFTPYLKYSLRGFPIAEWFGKEIFINVGISFPVFTIYDPDIKNPSVKRSPTFVFGFSSTF